MKAKDGMKFVSLFTYIPTQTMNRELFEKW